MATAVWWCFLLNEELSGIRLLKVASTLARGPRRHVRGRDLEDEQEGARQHMGTQKLDTFDGDITIY